jgi:hypothetical protein
MATAPKCTGTRAQQVTCYTNFFNTLPGSYNAKAFPTKGISGNMSWGAFYSKLAAQNPNLSAYQIYSYVVLVDGSENLGSTIGGAITAGGTAIGKSVEAIPAGLQQAFGPGSTCAWNLSLPVVGSFCLVSKVGARQILGVAMMLGAGLVGFAGIAVLVVYGLQRTGAGKAVTQSAAAVASVTGG